MKNLILMTDSYKASHFVQYPPGTQTVNSYIEARGGASESVFFGLQAFIVEYLLTPITFADIDEAEDIFQLHGEPFNREGWEYIVKQHGGYLPIEIEALPEGVVVPIGTPQVQVRNTDPKCFWLTSYIETALLRAVWYPSTVATLSREMKKIIGKALKETSDIPVEDQINFKLHDFGARGATSSESASIGGMAHLVNFMGTDTVEALLAARKYYGAKIAGFSIPASEHSTITSWGKDHEMDAFKNMIDRFSGEGRLYACVSDSYNIYNAVNELWGTQLKDKVISSGGTLVVRPDSGDPTVVPIEVIEALWEKFGGTVNNKGYRVLHPSVRVIQGDGITTESLPKIIGNLKAKGFSADNIAFGMGGGLLQNVNRDTLKYAMKASAIEINGVWSDVYKDPVHGGKTSKKGIQAVIYQCGLGSCGARTVEQKFLKPHDEKLLTQVFRNGEFFKWSSFEIVRSRAKIEKY